MSTTLFTGGTIVQVAASGESTHALLMTDDRITHVGDAALERQAEADSVVDLQGGTLIPGVGDGHCHPLFGAYEQLGPDIGSASSVAEIQEAVRVWISNNPDAEWVLGGSYDITLADNAEFMASWLDEVTGDIPTALRAFDHHTIWVNSAALRAAGYTRESVDPPLGEIVRDETGEPIGTLREAAANNLLDNIAPARTLDERVWAIETSTRLYAQQGTTWIQDAWVEPGDVDAYVRAAETDRIAVRVNLALRADPHKWRDQLDEFVAAKERVDNTGNRLLTAHTVKFFMDGVIEGRTALLDEPYTVDPNNYGIGNWAEDELLQATRAFSDAGFQLHLHAIGDAANRIALNALEALDAQVREDRPPVIAHVALVNPKDLERYSQLNTIANFEPYWAQNDEVMEHMTVPFIGEVRQYWQYPIASLVKLGGVVSFGSDWPVSTLDWRSGLSVAITHIDPSDSTDEPWIPEERISAHAGLAAYTEGIARQALAADRGTLIAGQVADLTWLSHNPLEADPRKIHEIEVLGTWVNGTNVYTR